MRIWRLAIVLWATIGLGACGAYFQGDVSKKGFWGASPWSGGGNAGELGLAAMAMGDYPRAEKHFESALRANPKNVYALLGRGIIYQNTGQAVKAREMYEAILAIRPTKDQKFIVWNNMTTRPVVDIASVNLALLESGGVLTSMGRGAAGQGSGYQPEALPGAGGPMGMGGVSGASRGSAVLGRSGAGVAAPPAPGMEATASAPMSMAGGDTNVISRFQTLVALRDQGLITQEEYGARRKANLGALLPLTAPPPAAGLDRPVPSTEQISGRLRAIARALEMRAISVNQHSAERTMILDALLPAAPVVVANPGAPPQGLMQAADTVRRLEYLRSSGLISSDQYTKERTAVEAAVQGPGMARPGAKDAAKTATAKAKPTGPQPAIHIASYRSKKMAERGWREASAKHKSLLRGLKHGTRRVNLGPRKGVYYRLMAGPFASKGEAANLCRKLKRRGQYCEVSFMSVE